MGAILLGAVGGVSVLLGGGDATVEASAGKVELGDGLMVAEAARRVFIADSKLDAEVVEVGAATVYGYRRVTVRDRNGRCFQLGAATVNGRPRVAEGYGQVPCPTVDVSPVVRGENMSHDDPARRVVEEFMTAWLTGKPVDRLVTGGSGIRPLGGSTTVRVTWAGDLTGPPTAGLVAPVSERAVGERTVWVEAEVDGRDLAWRITVALDGNGRWNVAAISGGGVIDTRGGS